MKKTKRLLVMACAALLMAGCANHGTKSSADGSQLSESSTSTKPLIKMEAGKDLAYYVEKARWGNSDALYHIARCYRDGIGVKRDYYRSTTAISQYEEYTQTGCMDQFFCELREDDLMRNFYECLEKRTYSAEECSKLADRMIQAGISDGFALKAIVADKIGLEDETDSLISKAVAQKSILAIMATATENLDDPENGKRNLELTEMIAPSMPFVNNRLGEYFNNSCNDQEKAAMYFRKAEENACLRIENAAWLLEKIQSHELEPADGKETKRLRAIVALQRKD